LHELTGWAVNNNVELRSLQVSQPTLEDVYLALTGGERDGASESRTVADLTGGTGETGRSR
jgi:hypothetical protein